MLSPIIPTLAISAVFALCPVSPAESAAPAAKAAESPNIPAPKTGQSVESGENRRLSPAERAAAREQSRKKLLDRFDQDGDGTLNAEERRAAEAEREAKLLERFDADGDGKLSEAERAAARGPTQKDPAPQGKRPERPAPNPPASGQVRRRLLKMFDTDGDGKLSESERAAARTARQKRANPKKK
ncbi:MAG: EF-hand domain-containing protein [Verrucomicrobiales bacterium]